VYVNSYLGSLNAREVLRVLPPQDWCAPVNGRALVLSTRRSEITDGAAAHMAICVEHSTLYYADSNLPRDKDELNHGHSRLESPSIVDLERAELKA
jgi:hypothetical protein